MQPPTQDGFSQDWVKSVSEGSVIPWRGQLLESRQTIRRKSQAKISKSQRVQPVPVFLGESPSMPLLGGREGLTKDFWCSREHVGGFMPQQEKFAG